MTTFVRLSEDDQAYDLVVVLNRVNQGQLDMAEEKERYARMQEAHAKGEHVDASEEAIEEAKESALGKVVSKKDGLPKLMDAFFNATDKIFAAQDDVVDAAFSLALAVFSQITNKDETATEAYVEKFCSTLTKDTKDKAFLRLKLLTVLFNLLPSSKRYSVFLATMKYASATSQAHLLTSHMKSLPAFMAEWGLTKSQADELRLMGFQLYEAAGKADGSQEQLYQYLKNVPEGPAVPGAAAKLVKACLAYDPDSEMFRGDKPVWFQYDTILAVPAVQDLQKSKEQDHKDLFALLQIFATGMLTDFFSFEKSSKNAVTRLGLDQSKVVDKMRTLTLCTLGMRTERLSYASLVKELGLSGADEVEEVVISAVTAGKIEARIDQELEEIVILRSASRVFDEEDWKSMATKLAGWRDNLEGVLNTLHAYRRVGGDEGQGDY